MIRFMLGKLVFLQFWNYKLESNTEQKGRQSRREVRNLWRELRFLWVRVTTSKSEGWSRKSAISTTIRRPTSADGAETHPGAADDTERTAWATRYRSCVEHHRDGVSTRCDEHRPLGSAVVSRGFQFGSKRTAR
ncbi:hypothetical protein PoB_001092800 [Plakobranchus ocellatus]|uniref:Secreted protein n=1 Tax=Plakobranchus ocellatus TaxID=259542 RepID=A0AAV3YPE7_9GAST|nr:hypothetical protein PoB_001092800 [Plakobranchus ocellatus]